MINEQYKNYACYFKALSDPNRLVIIDCLREGERCACVILEQLQITQSTLSYHMKTLCDCGIVTCRREGKWMHYTLNKKLMDELGKLFEYLS